MAEEKLAFRVLVDRARAEEAVSSLLLLLKWQETFEPSSSNLVFQPYYVFSFHIYDDVKGKTKILLEGFAALDAITNKFDERLGSELEEAKRDPEPSYTSSFRVLEPKSKLDDIKKILPLKLASEHNASKDNVIISNFELIYLPTWILKGEVGGSEVYAEINAVTGKFLYKEGFHAREKPDNEVISEAFAELSTLDGWINYTKEFISDIFPDEGHRKAEIVHTESHKITHIVDQQEEPQSLSRIFSDSRVQALTLGILALLAVIWFFYFK